MSNGRVGEGQICFRSTGFTLDLKYIGHKTQGRREGIDKRGATSTNNHSIHSCTVSHTKQWKNLPERTTLKRLVREDKSDHAKRSKQKVYDSAPQGNSKLKTTK